MIRSVARHPAFEDTLMNKSWNLEELFREAACSPERDRASLAGLLIESLEPAPEPDVEAAWSKQITRRAAELDGGTLKTIPWEKVRAGLFGRRNDR